MTACAYCGNPIDPRPGYHYQRIVGWERKSQGSGRRSGSDVVCRERREEFACNGCVEVLRLGLTPKQESLM